MNTIDKIAGAAVAFMFIGSSVLGQSLADARKAIDAEQYSKAKSMLKTLTTTQANKDENFFYLGWTYLLQDYPDSAKAAFTRGISVNAKSALNYAGLGAVAHVNKDKSGEQTNFSQAASLAGKDSKPYVYTGKAYMLAPADANAAITVLNKGIAANAKDPELFVALGDAYRSQLKSNDAYKAYSQALTLDPRSLSATVSTGVLWRYANNFEDSEKEFQKAIAIDPNYGPAYREWAETDLRYAQSVPAQASAKIQQSVEQYRKFLSLTDMSVESRMRFADFLVSAGKYKELQQEATALSQSANTNLKVYRYIGYSAYENGDYPAGLTALNNWISKADPKRIIPYDYFYLGRLQLKAAKNATDSTAAVGTIEKAIQLDSTQADLYGEIAKVYFAQKKYKLAGDNYKKYVTKSRKATLNDYFQEGFSYYFAFSNQYYSKEVPKPVPDTTLLNKADSAFAYIQSKLPTPNTTVTLYRARAADLKETDRNNVSGLAKPYYEKLVEVTTAKSPITDADKLNLAEAYVYLGTYYQFKAKDDAKALENFTKARENEPTNAQVKSFFSSRKPGAGK